MILVILLVFVNRL